MKQYSTAVKQENRKKIRYEHKLEFLLETGGLSKGNDPCGIAQAEMFLFLLKTPRNPMSDGYNSFLVATTKDV